MAVPVNPGGGFCLCIPGLPGVVFTHWVKIFGTPVFLAGTSRGVCCRGDSKFQMSYASGGSHTSHPCPTVPTATAFPRGGRLEGLYGFGGVIHTQFEGSNGSKHLVIGKSGEWCHPLPQFLEALCQLA